MAFFISLFTARLLQLLHPDNQYLQGEIEAILHWQSSSIFLYSPVRLRIVSLFVLICSDTHIQSIRFRTSISVSYNSVSVRIFAHSRTMTNIVDTDFFNTRLFRPLLHFVIKIFEDCPPGFFGVLVCVQVDFHFFQSRME